MKSYRWPKTDLGTVVLHWMAAASLIWLLLTGVRIASDDVGLSWLGALGSLLPVENLWFNHMIGGYILTATIFTYAIYVAKARLFSRIKFDSSRIHGVFVNSRARFACLNILLHWIFFVTLFACAATGWVLFAAPNSWALEIHLTCLWILGAFPLLHVLVQLRMGGLPQIARIFRPAPLAAPAPAPDLASVVADLLARQHKPHSTSGQSLNANTAMRG